VEHGLTKAHFQRWLVPQLLLAINRVNVATACSVQFVDYETQDAVGRNLADFLSGSGPLSIARRLHNRDHGICTNEGRALRGYDGCK